MATIGNDTIVVRLPYPVKIIGLSVNIKRKIGFSFTNMAMYLFRDNKGFKTSNDYKQWIDKNGENALISEMIYFSAIAYCTLNKSKQNFNKEGIIKAFALADNTTKENIITLWSNSETFGVKKKAYHKGRIQ